MSILRLIIIAALAGLAGCSSSNPLTVNPAYQWNVPDEERRKRLEAWFSCDECVNGQLRRVQELGNLIVTDLEEAMNNGTMIQVNGTDLELADSDAVILSRCTRFTTGLPSPLEPPVTTARCVARFEHNRDQRYRARARVALLAIRTEAACNALGGNICNNPDLKAFFPPVFIPDSDRSIRQIQIP